MERLKKIGVREGEGQWDFFHGPRIGHTGYHFSEWLKSLHPSSSGIQYGRHWREETTFVDRNYHGN